MEGFPPFWWWGEGREALCTASTDAERTFLSRACALPPKGPFLSRKTGFHVPLYLRLVAIPPRMCRSALFRSRTSLTWRYRARLKAGSRWDRSLCFVVMN